MTAVMCSFNGSHDPSATGLGGHHSEVGESEHGTQPELALGSLGLQGGQGHRDLELLGIEVPLEAMEELRIE